MKIANNHLHALAHARTRATMICSLIIVSAERARAAHGVIIARTHKTLSRSFGALRVFRIFFLFLVGWLVGTHYRPQLSSVHIAAAEKRPPPTPPSMPFRLPHSAAGQKRFSPNYRINWAHIWARPDQPGRVFLAVSWLCVCACVCKADISRINRCATCDVSLHFHSASFRLFFFFVSGKKYICHTQ